MAVGTSREVEIPWIRDIQVSRRGIIFLRHLKDKSWEVVGLRSGMVMVMGDDSAQASPLLIEVVPQKKRAPQKESEMKLSKPPNPLLSLDPKVDDASANGLPIEQEILLRAYVTLIEETAGEAIGFNGQPYFRQTIPDGRLLLQWSPEFSAQSSSRQAQTIAAPIFTVSTGSTATAQSGGEFRVQYDTEKGSDSRKEGWKEHGFRLTLTPEGLGKDEVSLSYSMTLKTISSEGNSPGLSTNELTGTIRLKKNRLAVAGSVDLSGSGKDSKTSFAGIPILGPLFRDRSSDRIKKKLVLWLQFDDSQDLMSEFGAPPPTTAPDPQPTLNPAGTLKD